MLRHSAGGDRFAKWPADTRILVRRENPHPGAQLSLFEQHEGKRYQVTATSTPGGQVQFLLCNMLGAAALQDGPDTAVGYQSCCPARTRRGYATRTASDASELRPQIHDPRQAP